MSSSDASLSTIPTFPPLSEHDFRQYNRLAIQMEYFHDHFRQTWSLMSTATTIHHLPKSMTQRQFLTTGLQFCRHLAGHHAIEEARVFPALAKKMPEFSKKAQGVLVKQHKAIHQGLDAFEKYLQRCADGEESLEWERLEELMGFGEVLFKHLDEEVAILGAENMRKYWTKEEILRLPM